MGARATGVFCIRKTIAIVTIAQFVLSAPAATFAGQDNLRPSAAKHSGRVYDIRKTMKDGGTASVQANTSASAAGGHFINVQDNMVGLFRAAQTGGKNTYHTNLQGVNGNLFDHSENRDRLEGTVKDMIISLLIRRQAILDAYDRNRQGTVKAYRVLAKEIKDNHVLHEDERKAHLERAQSENDKYLAELSAKLGMDLAALDNEYFISTKEQMSRLERSTGLNAEHQKLVMSWVAEQYNNKNWNQEVTLEPLVAQIVNRVKNRELKADIAFAKEYFKKYGVSPYTITTLCLGEKKSQYDANDPAKAWMILERDAQQMLDGISPADAALIGLRLAYEPRWVIGADTIPPDVLEKINDTHGFLKKVSKNVIGLTLAVDYGAAVKATTIESILALKNVDGVLIGSAANDPSTLRPIVEKTVAYVKQTGKVFNLGINWKANDADNGLKDLNEFVAMLKKIQDLDLITITIATPNASEARVAMDTVEAYFAKASLNRLGQIVTGTDDLGNGYSRDFLAQAVHGDQAVIENLFGEETRNGDTYMLLKKDGIVFAVAKQNVLDQTLMTVAVDDLTDLNAKKAYYADLLGSVYWLTIKTGKGIELIEEKGDRFRSYLSSGAPAKGTAHADFSLGELSGTKHWYGREQFFQMEYKLSSLHPALLTFKETDRKIGRGVSMIVQPKTTHLIFGFGTIGSQIAQASRKMGFDVVAINRSPNDKALNAVRLGIPLYVIKAQDKDAFAKAGIPVAGTMEELAASGNVVLYTDATDGKTKDPETGKEVTVAEFNKKYYYSKYFPNAKGMFEGAEDPGIADKPFDSGPLSKLGLSMLEYAAGAKSLFIPSCNTTGQGFIVDALTLNAQDKSLDLYMDTGRRANDPGQKGKLSPDGRSDDIDYHHADDSLSVRRYFPQIMKAFKTRVIQNARGEDVEVEMLATDAYNTHLTKFHITTVLLIDGIDRETGTPMTVDMVYKYLSAEPRISLVKMKKFDTTALIDVLQRNNIVHPFTPVIAVYREKNGRIVIKMANPQESVVIPNNMNALHALSALFETKASMRLVNEVMAVQRIASGIENTAPLKSGRVQSITAKDGGNDEIAIPMEYLTLDNVNVAGRTVLYRGDFNSPVDNGKLSITERLRANAPTIRELKQKGAKTVIVVHQGRKGDADYLENLQQYAELIAELIGSPVGYADDLFGGTAVNAIKAMKNGDVLVLKNVRSWDQEDKKDMPLAAKAQSDLVTALRPWIDLEVLDAFSIAHRDNISVVGFEAAGVPLIAGRLMEKEIKGNYRAALVAQKPYISSFGGAKIDDYLGIIRKGLKEDTYSKVHMSGLLGELALVAQGYDLGAPTMDFLAEQFKDFSDKKYGDGMQGIVKAIKEILDQYPDLIEIPVDLAYLDASGKRKEVVLTEEHKTKPAAETLIGDIGTKTAEKYAAQLKEAKTVFVKGPWGNYKNPEFVAASEIIAKTLAESKAYVITGGGDTNVLFERLGMTTRIDYFSLAGGAFLAFMDGKKPLPGLVALDASAKRMQAGALKMGISKNEYLMHEINSAFIHNRRAGSVFDNLVAAVAKTKEAQKGDLSKALWSAEVIKDSRGKPTVKATLQIGDITVDGFVPAGTSTGEDEANTVDPSQAVVNIMTKIHPMLAAANLDLGKHEDLVKADRMLQEAAGENFRDLGANATLPVSWALWKMAAKLHDMPLWLYFQRYEPRAVGKGHVFDYFNFGNGGEHAKKDKSEILGIHRMPWQEIMFVPIGAATRRAALEMADTVDQEYKILLNSLYGADNVSRALERGLTVKGLADPQTMTDLLIQAAINAGFKPGIDFQIAYDIAANSFYNIETKRYFINEQMQLTAPEMRAYILSVIDNLREKYHRDLFISVEDPLSENEWDEMTQMTAELELRGIRTIGDDLFVTQIRRVSMGVENRAGNVVLIKPNQNGTIIGTIDTMAYSLENGFENVASHRSGETLDPALADLAEGFRVLAMKTGAPQPRSEYPNPQDWERRNKYLRSIDIQENEAALQKAVIVGPDYFTSGGTTNALKQALALNKQVQFVLFGETAETIKAELADASIITASTLTGAVTMLRSFDYAAQNIVLVGSAAQEDAAAVKDIRQIPVTGIGTIALAQALNALLADETTQAAFAQFDKAMADFSVDSAVTEQLDQAIREEAEFYNKV